MNTRTKFAKFKSEWIGGIWQNPEDGWTHWNRGAIPLWFAGISHRTGIRIKVFILTLRLHRRKITGWAIIAALFIALYVGLGIASGWFSATMSFITAAVIAPIIFYATKLINH